MANIACLKQLNVFRSEIVIKMVLSEVITTGQLSIGREQEVVNLKTINYDRLRT